MLYIFPGYVTYYEDNGAIFVSSKLHQNTVKISDPELVKELLSLIQSGGCHEIISPLTRFLNDQELLVDKSRIEESLTQLCKVMESSLLLTIMPTEGCNFRCTYCYEDHAPITMRHEILAKIHTYIADIAPHFRRINISWFGGEPTLCKDRILETSALMQTLQNKHHFLYTSSMATNGYLLGLSDFLSYYHSGITAYQITLDGFHHDETRPHISGKGTLRTILDNLRQISSLPPESYQFHITIRHNILPGDVPASWYDYLFDLFGKDERFSILVRPVSNWGGESVQSLKLLSGKELAETVEKHLMYLRSIGMQCCNFDKEPLSQICYASYPHSMVFRSSGLIEKCTVCLNHPKNRLGFVDLEKGIVLNEETNLLWTGFALKAECFHCADILSCLNMQCPATQIVQGAKELECTFRTADILAR